ncbi:hypothetical protein M8818_007216 [Zalaria obscura]|uniref:Uncharacterized protein n=1 Tax=Zalaria obscura TaxID=2024903 RepID=A0ACC3S664_9PEZI
MLDTALGREGPPFPFMRLPSELRYTVYKLLLSYRAQDAPSVRLPLILEDRSLDVLVTNNLARIPFNDPYLLMRCGSMQTKLAILSVSKHIYQEALPYFYNSNRFHFETLWCLRQFLTGIGPERCGYLDQISVRYTVQMDQDASGAFKALTTCERLRSLRILNFDEAYYLDSRSSRLPSLRGRCNSPNDIPGISQLSQLRGIKDLSFSSPPCPQLEAFLRPLITRPHEASTDKGEEDKPVTKRKKVSTRKSGK